MIKRPEQMIYEERLRELKIYCLANLQLSWL